MTDTTETSARQTRHLALAAGTVSGFYLASIPNGGGSAGAMLALGLIAYRVGESDTHPSGFYLTAEGRSVAASLGRAA